MFNSLQPQQQWDYWYPRVYGYFYRRITDQSTVEDLTGNVLSTILLAKNVQNMNAYVWRVAHNQLVRYIDTKSKSPIVIGWDENQNWIPEQQNIEVEESVSKIFAIKMANLKLCIENQIGSGEDKNLIELSIYQEKNSTEIEVLTGIKSNTIRKKLSRLLQRIKAECRDLWHIPKSN